MALLELRLYIISRQEFGHQFLMHGYDAKYIPLLTVWDQADDYIASNEGMGTLPHEILQLP